MKRVLASALSVASLMFVAACSESATAPEAPNVGAPARALASNPQGWTLSKTVVGMQKECTPKGIENGMTCMQPVGSTTATHSLAAGDTVWILYEIRITAPQMGATATVIDDVIKQCQEQLGPEFGCSAWGFDIAALKTGSPVQFNADATVYTFRFWLDIFNKNACVPRNFTNTATVIPGTPPGAQLNSSATVTINVKPAPSCSPPPVVAICDFVTFGRLVTEVGGKKVVISGNAGGNNADGSIKGEFHIEVNGTDYHVSDIATYGAITSGALAGLPNARVITGIARNGKSVELRLYDGGEPGKGTDRVYVKIDGVEYLGANGQLIDQGNMQYHANCRGPKK